MSDWKVGVAYAGFEKLFQVYRLKDETEPDHSGNREIVGTFDIQERAQEYADELNRREGGSV